MCLDTDGCAFWSFASNRGVCHLIAADDFAMSKKGGRTSGSVLGECGASGVKLDEMAKCNCVENPSDAFAINGGGSPITQRVSPVIGPRIGARYLPTLSDNLLISMHHFPRFGDTSVKFHPSIIHYTG